MVNISDKSQCSGCSACQQACRMNAIEMHSDAIGHIYPRVDMDKCVDCGLCDKVCPFQHKDRIPQDNNLEDMDVFAVYNKDQNIREVSTSGGIFSILSEYVLNKGGVVFAAKFDDNYHVIHDCFESIEDIASFRGSKYVQSNIGDTFKNIKEELRNRPVLFVGTPCQVAGLKSFLVKDYDNLYTCDFICLGISPSKHWEEYLDSYWMGKRIESIFFKDKRDGWHQWKLCIKHDGGKEYLRRGVDDPYFYSYLYRLTFRPSCKTCPFRTCKRLSDFTMADCWGIDKVTPSFDDNKGCTTLILQSEKARAAFRELRSKMEVINYPIDYVKKYNPYIATPISVHPSVPLFDKLYPQFGFLYAVEKCKLSVQPGVIRRFLHKIKSLIKI